MKKYSFITPKRHFDTRKGHLVMVAHCFFAFNFIFVSVNILIEFFLHTKNLIESKKSKMEFPDEFYEKSTVSKSTISMIAECIENKTLCNDPEFDNISDSFEGILLFYLTDSNERLRFLAKEMLKASRLIRNNRLTEARLSLKNSHRLFLLERKNAYRLIKSLLTGLIFTTSIFRKHQLAETIRAWAQEFDSESSDESKLSDHQRMYREFKKLATIEELINFNQFFKEHIQRLIFEFTDELIGRMDFTIEYLKDAEFFRKDYKSERHKLDKLIKQSNSMKKQFKGLSAK
jgi:hypothetical protein